MPKNLVVCCDGTGNEFGPTNSNVVKLYSMLVQDESQVAYYHPGVGTMGARNALSRLGKWWTRILGLAFGYGISENVADAYQFLMRSWEEGDQIFILGFSRGAYTARALAGMLFGVGLLRPGNEGLIPYAIRLLRMPRGKKPDFALMKSFKKTFSRQCKTHFVGAWDTVSSVGWVYNAVRFLNTRRNREVEVFRHAISIDERRAFFRENLFEAETDQQDIRQVWFAGVHSDIGGGYAESESGLSKIGLGWMAREAEKAGLRLIPERRAEILGASIKDCISADPCAKIHRSLKGLWYIAEIWPKIIWKQYHTETGSPAWRRRLRFNLGRRRRITRGSLIHETVELRMQRLGDYWPSNLGPLAGLRQKFQVVTDAYGVSAARGQR